MCIRALSPHTLCSLLTLYYSWIHGIPEYFEERDQTFTGLAVKVAVVGAALGFRSVWVLPYFMVIGISRESLSQSVRDIAPLLRLASHLFALYASHTLTKARLRAIGPPLKADFLSLLSRAVDLTFLSIFAWLLFQAQFRKLFVTRLRRHFRSS